MTLALPERRTGTMLALQIAATVVACLVMIGAAAAQDMRA